MKSRILCILKNRDGFVSGQELCEELQVSRTAVWKVINQLKEEGYDIEAVSRKGYRIVNCPDSIRPEEVESDLHTKWAGRPVIYFPVIDSTNNYAKKIAEEGAVHGTLVLADVQESGKGRRGRTWTTPKGTTIAMTLVVRPEISPDKVSAVTLVMGMAVAAACREMYLVEAMIKWPNDVVINGKKICGILTELSAELNAVNYLVIGTGINANIPEMPEEIAGMATSLSIELGHPIDRAALIACCMKWFEQYYEQFIAAGDLSLLKEQYNAWLVSRGREVKVLEPNHNYTGISLGIDDRGELLVQKEDGSVSRAYAGEVSVRGLYGYV